MKNPNSQTRGKAGFLYLNKDIHSFLTPYLAWPALEALSIANKNSFEIYGEASKSRISIEGTEPLLHFCERDSHCHCSPCPGSEDDEKTSPADAESKEKTLAIEGDLQRGELEPEEIPKPKINSRSKPHVKHLELLEPGPIRAIGPDEERLTKLLMKLESFADANSGGMIASATSLCPNLQTLKVLQTPLPFTLSLAASLVSSTPKLRSLTYRTPHLDASALALVLCNLPELSTLDVSGVRNCWCRGTLGRTQGMSELASALSRARSLKRLVFTACKVLGVDNSTLFTRLGKASRDDNAICSHGSPIRDRSSAGGDGLVGSSVPFGLKLSSLEIRRSPVSGKSLAYFLSSPCCKNLSHLFVGGCKQVGATHLIEAFSNHSSSSSLDLELDGNLISEKLLSRVGSRLSNLRIFEPNQACLEILNRALRKGNLSRLLLLTIIPREEDIPKFYPSISVSYCTCGHGKQESNPDSTQVKSKSPNDLIEFLKLLKEMCPKTEVKIGDEVWMRMRESIAERKWWAEQTLVEERVVNVNEGWNGGVDVY